MRVPNIDYVGDWFADGKIMVYSYSPEINSIGILKQKSLLISCGISPYEEILTFKRNFGRGWKITTENIELPKQFISIHVIIKILKKII